MIVHRVKSRGGGDFCFDFFLNSGQNPGKIKQSYKKKKQHSRKEGEKLEKKNKTLEERNKTRKEGTKLVRKEQNKTYILLHNTNDVSFIR